MARGGGTGSRSKQKKKSDTVLPNGATTTNGINSDTDQKFVPTKVNKQRSKKEEGPAVLQNTDEDSLPKEEKINTKLQPTSEQLRLAQITQDSHLDPQRKGKISQVIDFTGKTEDEVATALFDCSWDVQRAIELLLEEGGDLGSWEESGKKKKKKQEKDKDEKGDDWDTDNFEPVTNRQDSDFRDRSRGRGGAPRFKRGGGQGQVGRQDYRGDGPDTDRMEGGRGRGGGRGMSRGGRGGMPFRQRGRGGPRGGLGAVGSSMGGGGGGPNMAADSGPFGQMDTWNPSGEEFNGKPKSSNKDAFDNAGNWGDDFPAAEDWDNDEYTGSLSDTKVFTPSGATPSLKSAVGDPINQQGGGTVTQAATSVVTSAPIGAGAAPSPATGYGQPIDLAALLQKPGITASAAPGGPTSINQFNQTATQDLKSAIGIGGPSPASKSAVAAPEQLGSSFSSSIDYSAGGGGQSGGGGIASSSQYSHNPPSQSNFGTTAPGSAFSPIKPASVTSTNKSVARARLPPPSKIPASAVEMPGDSLANLDVQFGGLEIQFGTSNDSSSSSVAPGSTSTFDYRSSSLSAPTKDPLDSKYNIAISSTDSFKPVTGSVVSAGSMSGKDVNQSLTSAMTAPGIKTSSSTDSSFGAAAAVVAANAVNAVNSQQRSAVISQQRSAAGVVDASAGGVANKANSNFSSQRSPVAGAVMDRSGSGVAVTESLVGFSASTTVGSAYTGYQVSNQTKQTSSQYGGHSTSSAAAAGYPGTASNNGYDRQTSSGYSAASYGGSGGGSVASSFGNTQASSALNNSNNSSVTAAVSNGSYNSNSVNSNTGGINSNNNTTGGFNTGYSNTHSYSSYSTKSTPTTGKLDSSSSGGASSYSNNFAISSTVSNKMGAGASSGVSNKMLHNLPPGVAASMIPQYMMAGAAGAAGFPAAAYLAAGLQQPLYGYGAAGAVGAAGAAGATGAAAPAQPQLGGVSSQQLEDLAAMQRNSLANLPLVGTAAGSQAAAASSKGPHTGGYYDPTSGFGSGQASTVASTRADATLSESNKFGSGTGIGGVTDSTSSPVPSTVATAQPTPFNALASTFAAAPTQHLPPGYAYFYGGMTPQLQAAYGGTSVYPPHPGIVPTATGPTATTQFQNKGYGSSYNSYDNLNLGQNNSDYAKSNFASQGAAQTKGTNSNAGHWYNGGLW